jgi:hypothetical protein
MIFLEFNVWEFSDFNSILKAVIADVSKKFGFGFWPIVLNEFRIKLSASPIELENFLSIFNTKFLANDKINYFRLFIAKKLNKNNKKLIIIFDDVDRILEEEILVNVFKLIAYFLNIPGVFTITAIDENNLDPKLAKYLDKITNLKVDIRKPRNFAIMLVDLCNNKLCNKETIENFRKRFLNLDITEDEFDLIEKLIIYEILTDLTRDVFKIWTLRELYILEEIIDSEIESGLTKHIFLPDIIVIRYLERYHFVTLEEYIKNYIYFVCYEDYSKWFFNISEEKIIKDSQIIISEEYYQNYFKKLFEKLLTRTYEGKTNLYDMILLIYYLSSYKIRSFIYNALGNLILEKVETSKGNIIITPLPQAQYYPQVFNFPSIENKSEKSKSILNAQDFYEYLIKPKRLNRLENFFHYFSSSLPLPSFLKRKISDYHPELPKNEFTQESIYEWTFEKFEDFCNNQLDNYFSFIKDYIEKGYRPSGFSRSLLWEKIKSKCFIDRNFKEKVVSIMRNYADSGSEEVKEEFEKIIKDEIKNLSEIIEEYKNNKENYELRPGIITLQ